MGTLNDSSLPADRARHRNAKIPTTPRVMLGTQRAQ
jgi:hypothetical protein